MAPSRAERRLDRQYDKKEVAEAIRQSLQESMVGPQAAAAAEAPKKGNPDLPETNILDLSTAKSPAGLENSSVASTKQQPTWESVETKHGSDGTAVTQREVPSKTSLNDDSRDDDIEVHGRWARKVGSGNTGEKKRKKKKKRKPKKQTRIKGKELQSERRARRAVSIPKNEEASECETIDNLKPTYKAGAGEGERADEASEGKSADEADAGEGARADEAGAGEGEGADEAGAGESEEADKNKRYCYCNGVSSGKMVMCDDKYCRRKWFHLRCVGPEKAPGQGQWFCDECEEVAKDVRPQPPPMQWPPENSTPAQQALDEHMLRASRFVPTRWDVHRMQTAATPREAEVITEGLYKRKEEHFNCDDLLRAEECVVQHKPYEIIYCHGQDVSEYVHYHVKRRG